MASFPRSQVAYGTSKVEFDPSSMQSQDGYGAAKHVSVDELVRLLKEIHQEAKQSGYNPKDPKQKDNVDRLYKSMWKRYAEFSREFPVIFRWTVQTMSCDEKAFRTYIKTHHKPFWKNRKEMLAAQAEYLVAMYRIQKGRDAHASRVAAYRKHIVEQLKKEADTFEEAGEEVKKIVGENAKKSSEHIRQALLRAAIAAKEGRVLVDAPARSAAAKSTPADAAPASERF